MITLNITSNENGRIVKTIRVETYQEAEDFCNNKGYYLDDYYLETVEDRNKFNALPGRTIYLDEER